MDANEYTPQPCPHQDDRWDCSECGADAYGGWSWRTCRHGNRPSECASCDAGEVERVENDC